MKLEERKKEEFVMKKLLALVLVFAMASWASAGLLTVVGDGTAGTIDVDPGQIVTITIVGTGWGLAGPADSLSVLTIGAITGEGTASDPALHAELSNLPSVGTLVNDGVIMISNIQGGTVMGDMDGIPNGSAAYTFTLDVGTVVGAYMIDLTGATVAGAFSPAPLPLEIGALEVNVVPEPMTIALLGLGGLFLRRRRS